MDHMSARDGSKNVEQDAGTLEKNQVENVNDREQTITENAVINSSVDGSLISPTFPTTLYERFLHIRQTVEDAIAAHHIFMIHGNANVIRECMLKRGWIERIYQRGSNKDWGKHHHPLFIQVNEQSQVRDFLAEYQNCQQQPREHHLVSLQLKQNFHNDPNLVVLLSGIGDLKDEKSQRLLISKMLINHAVDFLWNCRPDFPNWSVCNDKTAILNRLTRATFTSKFGLCSSVRQMYWYYEPGISNTLLPRCYNIYQPDHLHAFVEDFRLTACLSLLKWFIEKIDNEGENSVISPTGMIPLKALDFAIKRCSDFIDAQAHEDIDKDCEQVWSHEWDQFMCWYYKIVRNQELFLNANTPIQKFAGLAKHILKRMRKYWHQLDMDGIFNVWILKPGNRCRGNGIVLLDKIEDVMARIKPANKSNSRYVVQKYIERPLLIYDTKFDIRQWFIVTCSQSLTLWMYRESYLRFCSQKFCLNNLHESIHLSNNAVQCRYKNNPDRDAALPANNMWDATTFKNFLASQGHANAWDELIYPGMRQGLVGSLLANQDSMNRRKNSFELYGADFMVMEDFSVWLIEINGQPDLSHSTSVTARLCDQVLEDILKVIIDFREDKNASTGLFELVYKQQMPNCQPYLGTALSIQGTRIHANDKKILNTNRRFISKLPPDCPLRKKSTANSYIGPVIVDLIEELEIQLDRELDTYSKVDANNKTNYSSSVVSASSQSLASVQDNANPTFSVKAGSSININSKTLSPSCDLQDIAVKNEQVVHSPNKFTSKAKKIIKDTLKKSDVSSAKQMTTVTKEKKNRRNSSKNDGGHQSAKNKIQTEEKLIGMTLRNAVNRYKKYGSASLVIPPLPSLMVPGTSSNRSVTRSSLSNKIRNNQNNQKIREKSPEVSAEMYARGLGLNK